MCQPNKVHTWEKSQNHSDRYSHAVVRPPRSQVLVNTLYVADYSKSTCTECISLTSVSWHASAGSVLYSWCTYATKSTQQMHSKHQEETSTQEAGLPCCTDAAEKVVNMTASNKMKLADKKQASHAAQMQQRRWSARALRANGSMTSNGLLSRQRTNI